MSIYYQDDTVTLHHGDCLEVTGWLNADVLVTDPPYGMGYTGFGGRRGEPRRTAGRLSIAGDNDTAIRDAVLEMWRGPALVFGRWSIPDPVNTRQVLIWDKSDNGPVMGALDLPWGPSFEEVYVLGCGFIGKREGAVIKARGYTSSDADRPGHPTPKPVGLMELLISKCPPGIVADPFAGSGATLIAARNQGRRAIGVEVDERYCEVIASRLSQDVLDFASLAEGVTA